jgi:SAM-dependent methyltransferase
MARSGDETAAPLAHHLLTAIRGNANEETAMTTTTGSASTRGRHRGSRAEDFTTLEPKLIALYEAVLDDIDISDQTRLLDIGCGPGLFLRLAARRGAIVAGIDAAASLVAIARERLPDAELTIGEPEPLPYPDGCFDAVTCLNAFQFVADPGNALREAARVSRPGALVVVATWGRADQCEAATYLTAVSSLLPPHGAPDPFALSEPGTLEACAARAGLSPGERRETLCVWSFPDEATLLRALTSTGVAVQAIDSAGETAVTEAVIAALAPYRTLDAGYRVENTFTYLITHA